VGRGSVVVGNGMGDVVERGREGAGPGGAKASVSLDVWAVDDGCGFARGGGGGVFGFGGLLRGVLWVVPVGALVDGLEEAMRVFGSFDASVAAAPINGEPHQSGVSNPILAQSGCSVEAAKP